MICERCEVSVPMLQQRFDPEAFRTTWVCMRCAPRLQPHDGVPVRSGMSEEAMGEIREIGLVAWKEKRALEKKAKKNRNAYEMRALRRAGQELPP